MGPEPTLFLPESNGELHRVDDALIGQVHLREGLKSENNHTLIDIDSLRAIVHKPPRDIKERSFFKESESSISPRKSKKKSKGNINADSNSSSMTPTKKDKNENDILQTNASGSPKMKKKNKDEGSVATHESPKNVATCDSSFIDTPTKS